MRTLHPAVLLIAALPLAAPAIPAAAAPGGSRTKAKEPPPTLEAVIERLRRETGANIVPMWNAIEQAGIKRDAPIEIKAGHMPAGRFLRLALDTVSAGKEQDDRLSFVVDDGLVIIAPRKLLADKVELRSYEVSDLKMEVPNFKDAPSLSLDSVLPAFNRK